MPEGDVLQRGQRVRPHEARQAAHLLRADRVALVRHRARARLARRERLLRLEDFGALEIPDLERDLLERGREERERAHELGVPVALDDLGGDRLRDEPELAADLLLDVGVDVSEGPHRARDLPDPHGLLGPPQALEVSARLGMPEGRLEPEGGRLGVDAVGAADHQRLLVGEGEPAERLAEALEAVEQQVGGALELERERGVDDVRRRQPQVDEPGVRADGLLELGEKGDDVVARGGLELVDPPGVDPRRAADPLDRLARDPAPPRVHLADGQFDLEPGGVPRRRAPQGAHLVARVAGNHAAALKIPAADGGDKSDLPA